MTSVEDARDRVAQLVVTLRRFTRQAGATSTLLLLDQGEEAPLLVVECPFAGAVELSEGEGTVAIDADRLAAAPAPLPAVKALPPFEVDALRAQITAPLGGVEHLARAVRELAESFPGRSVLTATFATTDPETPLTLAARAGDPIVLALGEEQFEMGQGWPPE